VPEEIITTITHPQADGALEIALIHGESASPRVELRELVWGEGLGWYRQHTCKLDSRTVRTPGDKGILKRERKSYSFPAFRLSIRSDGKLGPARSTPGRDDHREHRGEKSFP
jgi:hypothetical protein